MLVVVCRETSVSTILAQPENGPGALPTIEMIVDQNRRQRHGDTLVVCSARTAGQTRNFAACGTMDS